MTTSLPKSQQWKLKNLALLPYDIDVAHNVTVAGTLVVTGAQTFTGNAAVTGTLTTAGLLTVNGGLNIKYSTVAAAGSTVTDAAQLAQGFNLVTAADATKGVKLPAAPAAGTVILIQNNAASILKVWPDASATINSISSNSDLAVAAHAPAMFVASSTTQWWSFPLVPS